MEERQANEGRGERSRDSKRTSAWAAGDAGGWRRLRGHGHGRRLGQLMWQRDWEGGCPRETRAPTGGASWDVMTTGEQAIPGEINSGDRGRRER